MIKANECICQTCNRCFPHEISLREHCRIHQGQHDKFLCIYCGGLYETKSELQQHTLIHSQSWAFWCDACGRGFKTKQSLKDHMMVHSGEKPHGCSVCGKVFRIKNNLRLHMRVHTGEKPYKCNICHHRFTQKGSLNSHMKKIHTDSKNIPTSATSTNLNNDCNLNNSKVIATYSLSERQEHVEKRQPELQPNENIIVPVATNQNVTTMPNIHSIRIIPSIPNNIPIISNPPNISSITSNCGQPIIVMLNNQNINNNRMLNYYSDISNSSSILPVQFVAVNNQHAVYESTNSYSSSLFPNISYVSNPNNFNITANFGLVTNNSFYNYTNNHNVVPFESN